MNAAGPVPFEREPVIDGQLVRIGGLTLKAVATPGHTNTHLSYIVRDREKEAVFSGGSLLYGSVGRTDLVAPEDTVGLTRDQYASVRALAHEADHSADLFPTHGFGSFCSSGPATGAGSSTVGEQLQVNHALTDADEEHFVQELIANLSAYPSYYAHMGPVNTQGPGPADLGVPESVDPAELRRRLEAGEWVVDLRQRFAFAPNHLQGSISFEYGDGSSFTTYLGWLLPWGEQVTLLGSREDVENAIRDLSRIGIDSPEAALGTDPQALAPDAPTASYLRTGWEEVLTGRGAGEKVLDCESRR